MNFVPVALFLTIVQSSKSNNLLPEYDYDNRLAVDPYQASPNDALQVTESKIYTNAFDNEYRSSPAKGVPGVLENPYQEVEEVPGAKSKKRKNPSEEPKKTVQPILDEKNVLETETDSGLHIATEPNSQINATLKKKNTKKNVLTAKDDIKEPPLDESVTDMEVNRNQQSITTPSWQSANVKKSKKNKKMTPTTIPAGTIEKPALDESEIGVEFNNDDRSTTELSSHFITSTKKITKKKKVTPTSVPEVTVVEQQLEDSVLDMESNNGDQLKTESIPSFTPSEIKSNKRRKLTSTSTPVIELAERALGVEDNGVNQGTTEPSQQYTASIKKANKKKNAAPTSISAATTEEPPLKGTVIDMEVNSDGIATIEPSLQFTHSTKKSKKEKEQIAPIIPVAIMASQLEETALVTEGNDVAQSTTKPSSQFTISAKKSNKKEKVTTTPSPVVAIIRPVIDEHVVVVDSHINDQSATTPSSQSTASRKKSNGKKMLTLTSATAEGTKKIKEKEPSTPLVENNVRLATARASDNESHENNTDLVVEASRYDTVSSSDIIDQNMRDSSNSNVSFEQLNERTNYKKLSVNPQSTDSRIQKMKNIENSNPESISTTQTYGTRESVSFSAASNEAVKSPKWSSTVSSKRLKLKTTQSPTSTNGSLDSMETSVQNVAKIKVSSSNLLSTTQTYGTKESVSLSNGFAEAAASSTWSPKFSSESSKPITPKQKKISSSLLSTSTTASPGSTRSGTQATGILVSVRSTLADKFDPKSNPVEQQSTTAVNPASKSNITIAASTLSSVTKSPTTVTQGSQSIVKKAVHHGSILELHTHSQAHREIYLSKYLMIFVGTALFWYL